MEQSQGTPSFCTFQQQSLGYPYFVPEGGILWKKNCIWRDQKGGPKGWSRKTALISASEINVVFGTVVWDPPYDHVNIWITHGKGATAPPR